MRCGGIAEHGSDEKCQARHCGDLSAAFLRAMDRAIFIAPWCRLADRRRPWPTFFPRETLAAELMPKKSCRLL
jgi:hypothetical protein